MKPVSKFLSYLSLVLAPVWTTLKDPVPSYTSVNTDAVSCLRYSHATDSEAEGAFVSGGGSVNIK